MKATYKSPVCLFTQRSGCLEMQGPEEDRRDFRKQRGFYPRERRSKAGTQTGRNLLPPVSNA